VTYHDQDGKLITLGPPLGVGGEAEVYPVNELPDSVAKIYFKGSGERYAKLRAMLRHPPVDGALKRGHVSICWPTRILFNAGGNFAGFLMPLMDRRRNRELFNVYHPGDRSREAPNFTWEYLATTAENVARVVELIHEQGYVIGDINESNFFVSEKAHVTLVDCDSIQVPTPSVLLRCPVGKPEFTAPELQGLDFSKFDRTKAHDNFGLAVLIFLLLMEGVHPYAGVWLTPDDVLIEERIRKGACPHTGSKDVIPTPGSLPFRVLPPDLQALFRRAFEGGAALRPSPTEWVSELRILLQSLSKCAVNSKHVYPSALDRCVWCERTTLLGGIDPFPLNVPSQASLPPQPFAPNSSAGAYPAIPIAVQQPTYTWQPSRHIRTAAARLDLRGAFIGFCLAVVFLLSVGAIAVKHLTNGNGSGVPATVQSVNPPPATPIQPPSSWPIDSIDLKTTEYIPDLGISVQGIQLFRGGTPLPAMGERVFAIAFDQSEAQSIYWQLDITRPAPINRGSFRVTSYLYGSDGSLYTRNQSDFDLEEGWVNSSLSGTWVQNVGPWVPGDYRITLFLNSQKVANRIFTIRSQTLPTQELAAVAIESKTTKDTPPTTTLTDESKQAGPPRPIHVSPQIPVQPQIKYYQATHKELGEDCAGVLTFTDETVSFSCHNHASQTFIFGRGQIKNNRKNGFELNSGKEYHFEVSGMREEQVSQLFANWFDAAPTTTPTDESKQAGPPRPVYVSPQMPVQAQIKYYQATHKEFGEDCAGALTLSDETVSFSCYSHPSQNFIFGRGQIRNNHKNGFELNSGKKYHFEVSGMRGEQVSKLFANWFQAR
jgi:Protein kinase domain